MYCLDITGYGTRKRRCESVVEWFLTKYLSRHHIYVEVLHRGLRREQAYGYYYNVFTVDGSSVKQKQREGNVLVNASVLS
jgi:hypothetical protein